MPKLFKPIIYFYFFFARKGNLALVSMLFIANLAFNIFFYAIGWPPIFAFSAIPGLVGIVYLTLFHQRLISNIIFKNLANKNKNWLFWLILLAMYYLIIFVFVLTNYLVFYKFFFVLKPEIPPTQRNNVYFLTLSSMFIFPVGFLLIAVALNIFIKNFKILVTVSSLIFFLNAIFNSNLFPVYLYRNHDLFYLIYTFRTISYLNPVSYPLALYWGTAFYIFGSPYQSFDNHYFFDPLNSRQMIESGVFSPYEFMIRVVVAYLLIPMPYALQLVSNHSFRFQFAMKFYYRARSVFFKN